jgi:hypothetical protein
MPAPALTYTQRTDFGVSNGPTYSGTTVVPDVVGTGTENYRNYSAAVLNTIVTTIDAVGFLVANLICFGFKMSVDAVQSGAPTPAQLAAATVTVHIKDVDGGIADYDFTLAVGEAESYVTIPAVFTNDCTAITVTGDGVVDCIVEGLILLAA